MDCLSNFFYFHIINKHKIDQLPFNSPTFLNEAECCQTNVQTIVVKLETLGSRTVVTCLYESWVLPVTVISVGELNCGLSSLCLHSVDTGVTV